MKSIREIIIENGGSTVFSKLMGIPLRTVEDWKAEKRHPPEWVVRLIVESLEGMR